MRKPVTARRIIGLIRRVWVTTGILLLLGMPVVVLIPRDEVYDKTLSNLKEVESRGGRIIAVTDAPDKELGRIAESMIEVPATSTSLMPLVLTIPMQLLAYYVAVERGTDVDQPRNLAKSVTVE